MASLAFLLIFASLFTMGPWELTVLVRNPPLNPSLAQQRMQMGTAVLGASVFAAGLTLSLVLAASRERFARRAGLWLLVPCVVMIMITVIKRDATLGDRVSGLGGLFSAQEASPNAVPCAKPSNLDM